MKRFSIYFGVCLLAFGGMLDPLHVSLVPEASAQELVSGQRVRVKKLARDMKNVRESIVTTGPSHFQDVNEINKFKKRFGQFNTALARYPQVTDPDVKAARREYKLLQEALTAEFKRAQDQLGTLGDVQKSLALLDANNKKYPVPAPLKPPFSEADAKAWVEASSNARTVAEHNKKQVAIIAPLAYLPKNRGTVNSGAPYDSDDVKRLGYQADDMFKKVQNGYAVMSDELSRRMTQTKNDVTSRWQENPDSDKRWLFLQDSQAAQAEALFSEGLAIANSSVYLERALGREPTQALDTIAAINKAKADFARNREVALATSRLPKPKSKNKKQIKIAKKILEIPRYEFGKYGPIILTTPKITEHEREDSEFEVEDMEFMLGDKVKVTGTKTTWTYKWKEFRFAVPLQEDNGDWHIWWITARNYSSGSSITPLNQWISGKAVKGNKILKKNF